jgi:endonuclease/exonuclease/phosphatase (EEP) superfamily protein YafD
MNAIWRTIRSYILWQHERGTLHYDIMVTLILIFIFFSPRVINFNDKPISRNPHPTEVVVTSDVEGRLLYQVAASAVSPGDEQSVREQLLHIIEPISGAVSIVSYEVVSDQKGKAQSYKVLAKRD